jgi:hypothetical protein
LPTSGARSQIRRAAVLGLVLAIHAALVLIASRWVMRVHMRSEQPLVFLALPDPAHAAAPTASPPASRRKAPASRDTQLVTIPKSVEPSTAGSPPAAIDWMAQADWAVQQQSQLAMTAQPRALDKQGAGADLNGGLGADRGKMPEFGWDRAHTHRVETLEGGAILININDRCIVILTPFPWPFCGIGKIPARGDLFDLMRSVPQMDGNSKNIAP